MASVQEIAVSTNNQYQMATFNSQNGAKATFGVVAKHYIHFWVCHPELSRQKAFDACYAELERKKPQNKGHLNAT